MKNSVFKRTLVVAATAAVAIFSASALISAAPTGLRSIFLNGMDISGARNQQLKNVDIQISESGDIFIIAPHYQVSEEDAFTPLSKFVQGINAPAHKQPQKVSADLVPGLSGAAATPAAGSAPTHTEPKALESNAPANSQDLNSPSDSDGSMQKPEDPPPALPDESQK